MEANTFQAIAALQPTLVLIAAACLDYAVGDPWHWPHPVQGMGWFIQRGVHALKPWAAYPRLGRGLGCLLAAGTIGGSVMICVLLLWLAQQLGGWSLATLGEIAILASCFAGRSLRQAADTVLAPLSKQDLTGARQSLAAYVGRDTERLSEQEILRATVETVSENATDGVMAPLFYAALGGLLGLGLAPLAIGYKAASTLDSMVGYRTQPYTYLGWASARLEDGLTWLPCRLLVLTVGLLSGRPARVGRLCRRDAIADPSPNAGWSECAYAAALGIQLGGENSYRGRRVHKPLLGDPDCPITAAKVGQALAYNRRIFLLWLAIGGGALAARAWPG